VSTRYAEKTSVGADRTKTEIEATLRKYGARAFGYLTTDTEATIMFEIGGRKMRFRLPMPDRNARKFTHTPARGQRRSDQAIGEAWEQAQRQSWRALALVIKAKLEAVEAGITTIEEEFLAHILLPDGSTVGAWTRPQLEAVYASDTMPALLPGGAP
jgi:hypothetical protein